jgi:hypothetical protein
MLTVAPSLPLFLYVLQIKDLRAQVAYVLQMKGLRASTKYVGSYPFPIKIIGTQKARLLPRLFSRMYCKYRT